jgi:hypothetical protein
MSIENQPARGRIVSDDVGTGVVEEQDRILTDHPPGADPIPYTVGCVVRELIPMITADDREGRPMQRRSGSRELKRGSINWQLQVRYLDQRRSGHQVDTVV